MNANSDFKQQQQQQQQTKSSSSNFTEDKSGATTTPGKYLPSSNAITLNAQHRNGLYIDGIGQPLFNLRRLKNNGINTSCGGSVGGGTKASVSLFKIFVRK